MSWAQVRRVPMHQGVYIQQVIAGTLPYASTDGDWRGNVCFSRIRIPKLLSSARLPLTGKGPEAYSVDFTLTKAADTLLYESFVVQY